MSGLLRDRLPVAGQLYLAQLDGRLVRADGDAFAVLEFPLAVADDVPLQSGRQRRLRRLDTYWSSVALMAPAGTLLVLAAGTAVVGRGHPGALLTALVLVGLAVSWVLVLLVGSVLVAGVSSYRSVERRSDARAHAVSALVSEHWHLSVCQAGSAEQARALVDRALATASELDQRWDRPRGPSGGPPLLLCLLDGITTDVALHAVQDHPDAMPMPGVSPPMVALGVRREAVDEVPTPVYPARGIFLLLGAVLTTVLICPVILTDELDAGCAEPRCSPTGRYWLVLSWLVSWLIPFQDSASTFPVTVRLQVFGWLTAILGFVVVVAVLVAGHRHLRFQQHGRDLVYRELLGRLRLRQPTLALVTTSAEAAAAVRTCLSGLVQSVPAGDRGRYVVGELPSTDPGRPHTVLVTQLGESGNSRSATAVANVARSFDTVRCIVLTGIGSGVPRPAEPWRHVRLGDVVVASRGLVDLDSVDQHEDGPHGRPGPTHPPELLLESVTALRADAELGLRPWEDWLGRVTMALVQYWRPDPTSDVLHDADGGIVAHPPAADGWPAGMPMVHHGLVGSSDQRIRSARVRDALTSGRAGRDLLALESAGRGVGTAAATHDLGWLVVLGIGDYADGDEATTWHRYAAAAAAGYVAALLGATAPLRPPGGSL
jgi:nucleoside phosphorylase